MTRKALGKGLGALISQKQSSASAKTEAKHAMPSEEKIIHVDIDSLKACPFQPRRIFKEEQIAELAASIQQRGLIQPLAIRIVDGQYELIAGERRLRAARSIGMKQIRAVVYDASDMEVAELALIENLQREDLTPLEEAEQYRLLQKKFGLKQAVIANHVGKNRAVIANMIRLLELQPEVRELLNEEAISVGHAKVLLQLKQAEQQIKMAKNIAEKHLTVRKTEQCIREILNPSPKTPKLVYEMPSNYAKVCKRLSKDFGTKVIIAEKGKNNGVIEIPYIGKSELNRILQIFGVSTQL